ncbi:indole-3-glycerol phosphate synthase [Clostridia bacterium]|nr:indole-3-glycerol phosphate synthase [Clostridia bacterium]
MILEKIVIDKEARLVEQKKQCSPLSMKQLAEETKPHPADFYQALQQEGLSIIGEFKKASPSLGTIPEQIPLEERIRAYNESVDAISCLTEEDHFLGSAEDLQKVRQLTELPILRKDFMIDEYQFYEAKYIGANGVLLIAAILEDVRLRAFYQLAKELSLAPLVEVHDEWEMERALYFEADIIGINNRNLRDFTIRLETTARLAKQAQGSEALLVSESGIVTDEDVNFLKDCEVDAFLIGRALMESKSPKALAKRWKEST